MNVDTKLVFNIATALDAAVKDLDTARKNYERIKALNGQSGYSVVVNDVRIYVAVTDHTTWNAMLIRGREMIHLGALKALAGEVRRCEEAVAVLEGRLRSVASPNGAAS